MPVVLDPEVVLEKHDTEISMYKRCSGKNNNHSVIRLDPVSAVILSLFNGRRDVTEIREILRSAFHTDTPLAELKLQTVMERYSAFLLEKDNLVNDKYNPVDFVELQERAELEGKRLEVPFVLTFYLTRYCPHRCVYCAINTRFGRQAKDACLPLARLKELFDEAADIRVSYIDLTGGEPFLRDDVINILAYLVQKRLKFSISTKFAFTFREKDAQNLKRAGVKEVVISIDSHRPEMADFLSGTASFYQGTITAIKWLKESNLSVVAFPVLTNLTIREFPAYVDFFAGLGVDIIRPGIYQKIQHPKWDKLLSCNADDLTKVIEFCSRTQTRIQIDTSLLSGTEGNRCQSGLSNIIVTPNGKTVYCTRLLDHKQLVFGDLKTQSIMEVWNSSCLHDLVYPSQETLRGTKCYACLEFPKCYHEGFCVYSSYVSRGLLIAPYLDCPKVGRSQL